MIRFLKLFSKIKSRTKMSFKELQKEITRKEVIPRPLLMSDSNISSISTFKQNMKRFLKLFSMIKSWRGLWTASSDSWCQSTIPHLALSQAIFVVRQLQEKYLAANKRLYMAFVDLEVFDQMPLKVIWWVLSKLGVEWIVQLVQGMYANAQSHVRVGEGYSEEFEVKVSVHHGWVLSLLLFIIVLEALWREFHSGVPWEDLYADDLVIITESLKECVRGLLTWKEAMEEKGQSKCRKAEFRPVSICCLSLWSGQQQHLL